MRPDRETYRHRLTDGFTLLEVILALAILAGAVVVVGEAVRLGRRNAEVTRLLTTAQLLAASKMAEVTSGIVVAESVEAASFETAPDWLYSIDIQTLPDLEGLVEVTVSVTTVFSSSQTVDFSLTRWMVDPELASEQSDDSDQTDGSDGDSSA